MSYTHACQGCGNIIQTDFPSMPAYCPVCLAAKNQREKDAVNNPVNYVSDEACKASFAQAEAQEKTNAIIFGVIAVIAGVVLIPIFLPLIIMAVVALLPVAIVGGIIWAIVVAVNSKQPPQQGP